MPRRKSTFITPARLQFEVTEEIIQQSISKNSSHCVIAESLKKAYPGARGVSVDLQTIRWSDPNTGKRYIALTPPMAQATIIDFDQGEPLRPFTCRLRASQIVNMARHPKPAGPRPKPATPEELAAAPARPTPEDVTDVILGKGKRKYDTRQPDARRRLAKPDGGPRDVTGNVPVVVGGRPPKTAVLSSRGRMRAYGLRALRP